MKRILLCSIPVVTIGIFIFIMNSSFLFKEPGGYQIPFHIETMEQSVLHDDWNAVDTELTEMNHVIKEKIFPFIQYSVEKDEMLQIDLNISKVRGCINTRNKDMAMVYLQEIENNWDNLNK